MKYALALIFTISLPCFAQTPIQNLYAAGGSYNFNATPAIAGTALYAHYVASPGTYAFTVIDAIPNTTKPFVVTSNIGIGLAQKMFSIGKVSLFMPTAAGISWTGTNTGWQWTGGAAVTVPISHNLYLMPTVRFLKSSVSGGSDYEPVAGLLFGWGK